MDEAAHLGGTEQLLVASCWVPCDELAHSPGPRSDEYCFKLNWTICPLGTEIKTLNWK